MDGKASSESSVSRNTDLRALRRAIVLMEINDLAAIEAIRTRRKMKVTLAAYVEINRAARRRKVQPEGEKP